MRIANPNSETQPFFYAGKCKNNTAPKHVEAEGAQKKAKFDKQKAVMFDSPKTAEYIYIKVGENWLYVKDKTIFGLDALTSVPVTRSPEGQSEASVGEETAN